MTRTEAEWDKDERGLVLAQMELEADQCPGCGGQITETAAPESEGRWNVPPPTRCHKCDAISMMQEGYREQPRNHTLLWSATRK